MSPIVIIESPHRLDATAAPVFSTFVLDLVAAGATRLIVDFSSVNYLGSSGVRGLMQISKAVTARQGRLVILGCPPGVTEVLHICGLEADLPMVELIEDARQRV